jgi:hypothetical protein
MNGASAILAVVIAASLVLPSARAATPEELYIAARDAAIAKIKAAVDAEKRGPMDNYGTNILAVEEHARAGLEQQMRAIVGAVAIKGKGMEESALNLDTLIEGDLGFGLLDGMVYGPVDGKTRVVVTTESMFQRWLNQHKDSANIPEEPSAAVKEDTFYTQAVLTDSAVVRFAELPIHPPAGAAFAFAMLAARTQSEVSPKADEIFVAVAQGGRVFIAQSKEVSAVGPIASCDAIRGILVKKSVEAGEEPGLDDKERREKSEALRAKSEAEFLRCFVKLAPRRNDFVAAAKAAQALIDRHLSR